MKYGFYNNNHEKFPPIVHLETTNICNLKCIHCAHSRLDFEKYFKPQTIDLSIFRKVAEEVGENNGILRLTSEGEPSTNKKWLEELKIALNSGVKMFAFNTNGLLINKETRDLLLTETSTQIAIEFSIDSLYYDSYSRIRRGDYKKLLSNIFSLIDGIERNKRKNIKILVSCITQPELDEQEYKDFVRFWTPIVDKVITRPYSDANGLTEKKPSIQKIPAERYPCPFPFTRMVIGINGDIRFCPCDVLENTNVANIKEKTIKEVWTSEWMNKIRESHLNGTYDGHEFCKNCTHWPVLKWGNDYVKALTDLFGEL